jgi:hypothetical protein
VVQPVAGASPVGDWRARLSVEQTDGHGGWFGVIAARSGADPTTTLLSYTPTGTRTAGARGPEAVIFVVQCAGVLLLRSDRSWVAARRLAVVARAGKNCRVGANA